jgi:hypothetical protein
MLPSTDSLSRLLGCLYDAASDPTLWEAFLRELASVADAQSAAVVTHGRGSPFHAVAQGYGLDPHSVCQNAKGPNLCVRLSLARPA